jgi:hypothetical protein
MKTKDAGLTINPLKKSPRLAIIVAAAIVITVCAVIVSAVRDARHTVNTTLCTENLFKLKFALLNYDDQHGSLPPAVMNGPNGQPAHSWRVLILPHLDTWEIQGELVYRSYDMTKRWNDPKNRVLFKPVKESRFACLCGSEVDTTRTSYVVIVGEDTLFPPGRTVSISDVPRSVDPIMVLEITNSTIEWPEPKDLLIDDLATTGDSDTIALTRPHAGAIRFITLRGSTGYLPAGTSVDVVRQLASIKSPIVEETKKAP